MWMLLRLRANLLEMRRASSLVGSIFGWGDRGGGVRECRDVVVPTATRWEGEEAHTALRRSEHTAMAVVVTDLHYTTDQGL